MTIITLLRYHRQPCQHVSLQAKTNQLHRSVVMQQPRTPIRPKDQICHIDHIPDVDLEDSAGSHLSSIAGWASLIFNTLLWYLLYIVLYLLLDLGSNSGFLFSYCPESMTNCRIIQHAYNKRLDEPAQFTRISNHYKKNKMKFKTIKVKPYYLVIFCQDLIHKGLYNINNHHLIRHFRYLPRPNRYFSITLQLLVNFHCLLLLLSIYSEEVSFDETNNFFEEFFQDYFEVSDDI